MKVRHKFKPDEKRFQFPIVDESPNFYIVQVMTITGAVDIRAASKNDYELLPEPIPDER